MSTLRLYSKRLYVMIKKLLGVFLLFFACFSQAQTNSREFRSKLLQVQSDTVYVDTLSISSYKFKLYTSDDKLVPESAYQMDFAKARLILSKEKYTEVKVEYHRYPDFLTKVYTPVDRGLIVENTKNTGKLYSATTNKQKVTKKIFDGLETQGFISRGITVGNNQNGVTNASLDLSVEGKLSKKISIRANIFDTNFPLQQSGYSQNLTDFDRVFVEMFSKNWKVTGGDLSLQNINTNFLLFEKQVSGVQIDANIANNFKVLASGALVKGQFSSYNFVGIEGNQGPYKLFGPNNESNIILVQGSDKVFVNGVLVQRGETKDYVIDYNLAEIRFNTTYPITNDMRIRVEFQYAENNYNRFITYDNVHFKNDKLSISGYFYSENDAKSQPVQQSLTEEQQQILSNAGNDTSKMITESAFADAFSESRIQYTKQIVDNEEVFVYTTNEEAELYTVTFTNVGANQGSYELDSTIAIGNIYSYVGENLGSYEPVTFLVAPQKLQVAVADLGYNLNEKSSVNAELALSNYDANLFSDLDDDQNKNLAANVSWNQVWLDKKWEISTATNYNFVQDDFRTVQRFRSVEFDRDWNLLTRTGNQNYLGSSITLNNKKESFVTYGFEHLNFSESFNGNKHVVSSLLKHKKTQFELDGSLLYNTSSIEKNNFFRMLSSVEHSFNKLFVGTKVNIETNARKNKVTDVFETTSHRFKDYEAFAIFGDSTKLKTKFGVNYRENDSIISDRFTQINNRKTFYIDSKLIDNSNTKLSVYANYRFTKNAFIADEQSLNSQLIFNQQFLQNLFRLNTTYESSSGNLAQQNYVYIETETGQGYYTWIDYNEDGIQDFEEFEVAQFQDQANYLRIALPNLTYLQTQKARLKQSLTIYPKRWENEIGIKKLVSKFYNQSYLSIDNEQERSSTQFFVNPFDLNNENLLALSFNFRNNLYFNRSRQKYSVTYTYGKTSNKQLYTIGNQESKALINQLQFEHKLYKFLVFNIKLAKSTNELATENFSTRNYDIKINELEPKLTFAYNQEHRLSLSYLYKNKENKLADFEKLAQQKVGVDYFYITKKQNQISASANVFLNDFNGDENTPVGYQMLEGLQTGNNYTWNVLWNKKLSKLLQLNLNYFGRKSESSNTIHSGAIELKAVF